MKNLKTILLITTLLALTAITCPADTFCNKKTKETLHGYQCGRSQGDFVIVQTAQKGRQTINLTEWTVTPDRRGRNNQVIILTIKGPIKLDIETKAFIEALKNSSDQGPLFILIEMDTPGGNLYLAHQMCLALKDLTNCQVVVFIRGNEFGGAISAGAAVAFACDKVYMADNAIIGAATAYVNLGSGPEELRKVFGDEIGEKFSSAWRAYLAALAQQKDRPGLLARAMISKDIEVIEVNENGKRLFIDPVNKKPNQAFVRSWSKKDSLLTLTAAEAAQCGVADKIINSREELLKLLDADSAKIVINTDVEKAAREFTKAKIRFDKIWKGLDFKSKQLQNTRRRSRGMAILKEVRQDFRTLRILARRYPDLGADPEYFERQLNSVEAAYQGALKQ